MKKIDSVGFGEIIIDGKTHFSDVILFWNGEIEYIPKSHELEFDDFMSLTEFKPTAVIVGTAENEIFIISKEVRAMAKRLKILLYIEPSTEAAEIFNAFMAEGEKPIAVIHTG